MQSMQSVHLLSTSKQIFPLLMMTPNFCSQDSMTNSRCPSSQLENAGKRFGAIRHHLPNNSESFEHWLRTRLQRHSCRPTYCAIYNWRNEWCKKNPVLWHDLRRIRALPGAKVIHEATWFGFTIFHITTRWISFPCILVHARRRR